MPLQSGPMNVIYIRPDDERWNNEFIPPNRQFIYWDTDATGTTFARNSLYNENGITYFAVLNLRSDRICGIYRFGDSAEKIDHDQLEGRHLLIKVANLNHEFTNRPGGFTYGCRWNFDPNLVMP